MTPRGWWLAGILACSGCSAAPAVEPDASAPAEDAASPPVEAAASRPTESEKPMRVLVTGFNDWKDLGEPPELWRCRDNPSCRLLLGAPRTGAPSEYPGPLATRLQQAAPTVEWRFATMPVTWGAVDDLPDDLLEGIDVTINIGLGVYDRFDALQLEAGAYNLRRGTDAAGDARDEPIRPDEVEILEAPAPVRARLAELAGRHLAGYEVVVADARESNSYLCNETHYRALSSRGSSDEVYFLHIPHAENGDYEALAEAVATLVLALVDAPQRSDPETGRADLGVRLSRSP